MIIAVATVDVMQGRKYPPTTPLRNRLNEAWMNTASGAATKCCGTPEATASRPAWRSD